MSGLSHRRHNFPKLWTKLTGRFPSQPLVLSHLQSVEARESPSQSIEETNTRVDDTQDSVAAALGSSTGQPSDANVKNATTAANNFFALLIGINNYNNSQNQASGWEANISARDSTNHSPTISDLCGAVADAQKFEAYLLETLKVNKDNISVLLDRQATRENIINAFKSLADNDKIKKDDSIFIYYAGHGAQTLSPKRLFGVPGCPELVELILPYDFINTSADYRRMGIPDFTVNALLNKISKEKGNNITIVLDTCFSASATRKRPTFVSSHESDSQEIVRAGPYLDHPVPDNLDEEIWGGNPQNHTGFSPWVLFTTCRSSETAKEKSGQGYFTNALLTLLMNYAPDTILCSLIVERLQGKIEGQHPQCIGLHSNSRPFFQGYTAPYRKNFFRLIVTQGRFTLQAGNIHGLCKGDQLLVYESGSMVHQQKQIATAVITQVSNFTSNLRLVSGSEYFAKGHSDATAVLSKMATQYFKVYVEQKKTLLERIEPLGLCIIMDARSDADIAISLHSAKKQLCIDVVEEDLSRSKGIKLDLKPRFVDDTDKNLAHVMKGLSHYYHHLKQTSDSLDDLIDQISISFYEVQHTGLGHVVKANGASNLCQNNVIDINVKANPDAIYGCEITNNTSSGEVLYPFLFFFDNTEFTISQVYPPQVDAEWGEEFSWIASRQPLTIGYGVGTGSNVMPLNFYVDDDYTVEIGFLKLFLFKEPVNLQDIIQEQSVFTRRRVMEQKVFSSKVASSNRWGSITLTVIQRNGTFEGPPTGRAGLL